MKLLNDWRLLVLLCLTLGLAPYTPEPHIIGKLRWVAGGAKGMQFMDYFDLLLHGTPFFLLVFWFGRKLLIKEKKQK
jgi:hypothetical protein